MSSVMEITVVNILHLVFGNYSSRLIVSYLVQEMGLKLRSQHKKEQAPLASEINKLDTKQEKLLL
jgi:hypothetical protein